MQEANYSLKYFLNSLKISQTFTIYIPKNIPKFQKNHFWECKRAKSKTGSAFATCLIFIPKCCFNKLYFLYYLKYRFLLVKV